MIGPTRDDVYPDCAVYCSTGTSGNGVLVLRTGFHDTQYTKSVQSKRLNLNLLAQYLLTQTREYRNEA
jgi:hypothetical protein